MTIAVERTQNTFMYMIRDVSLVRGTNENGTHRIIASPVKANDIEPDSNRLAEDPDGVATLSDYAARTIGEPWIFETSEPNRWVIGELISVKVKPVR